MRHSPRATDWSPAICIRRTSATRTSRAPRHPPRQARPRSSPQSMRRCGCGASTGLSWRRGRRWRGSRTPHVFGTLVTHTSCAELVEELREYGDTICPVGTWPLRRSAISMHASFTALVLVFTFRPGLGRDDTSSEVPPCARGGARQADE